MHCCRPVAVFGRGTLSLRCFVFVLFTAKRTDMGPLVREVPVRESSRATPLIKWNESFHLKDSDSTLPGTTGSNATRTIGDICVVVHKSLRIQEEIGNAYLFNSSVQIDQVFMNKTLGMSGD